MILTVEEFRQHYETDESDAMLKAKLDAIEALVRNYTNNSFQARGFTQSMEISEGVFSVSGSLLPFKVGDTVQVKESQFNNGLYTIKAISGLTFTVNEETIGNDAGTITKIKYPPDVIMGVVNLMKWELERRDKVGISSETLSRHSVTYADMTNDNTLVGYPKMLISFLFPYKRARFGKGVSQ